MVCMLSYALLHRGAIYISAIFYVNFNMSEFEKLRDSKNRKYFPPKEKKEFNSKRIPVILAKPDRDAEKETRTSHKNVQATFQPTILLRNKEQDNRAKSPAPKILKKEPEPVPVYTIQKHEPPTPAGPPPAPPKMTKSVKLLDESLQMSDGCLEFLRDQSDYMVIGCLGLQGTGKSTIMSLLAGNNLEDFPSFKTNKPKSKKDKLDKSKQKNSLISRKELLKARSKVKSVGKKSDETSKELKPEVKEVDKLIEKLSLSDNNGQDKLSDSEERKVYENDTHKKSLHNIKDKKTSNPVLEEKKLTFLKPGKKIPVLNEVDESKAQDQLLHGLKIKKDMKNDNNHQEFTKSTGQQLPKSPLFKPQSKEHMELGSHCTSGIDLMITQNRTIFLDVQPLMSPSIMDKVIQQEGKRYIASDFSSTENAMEMQSLQLAAFLLSVCHVVILLQDWFFDPNLFRILQTAEMLKPSTPTKSSGDVIIEYYPHIIFVHNRCTMSDFSPRHIKLTQTAYTQAFMRSRLMFDGELGIATGHVVSQLNPESCGDPINLYLLPDFNDKEGSQYYNGHPSAEYLVKQLRRIILGATRNPLTHTSLSEKNWFHYAAKIWDNVKKCPFFMEYSRVLP